jgi:Holliday junction resolvasome RuvABC endonuclease subunit
VLILLSLDVSSTAAGWAVLTEGPKPLVDFGLCRATARTSLRRMAQIRNGLLDVARAQQPTTIVMEWSSGKIHGRKGRIHGMAVLGQAQGIVWQSLVEAGWEPHTVSENEWTRGKKKQVRAAAIAAEFAAYRGRWQKVDSSGYDVADAIGLGLWWIVRNQEQQLMKGGR